ncbi:MAG: hypothetical protein KAS32_14720 [Candidatus Peribacteraceae bacterium]|nr:hypothetical protein [Candidatus Peribacteraceae bacterium]
MKRQIKPWSCGRAVVRNVLRVFDIKTTEACIQTYTKSTKHKGTDQDDIITAIWGHSLDCSEISFNDPDVAWFWLHNTLTQGLPVILCVENWEHWVSAIGSLGDTGIAVFDSSNFKNNTSECGTHIWNYDKFRHKIYNDRKNLEDASDFKGRIYAISVWKE